MKRSLSFDFRSRLVFAALFRGFLFLSLVFGTSPLTGSSCCPLPQVVEEKTTHQSSFEFEAPVRLLADGKPIQIESPGYAAPTIVDLDRDGKEDLVVGQFAGGRMKFYRNLAQIGEIPRYGSGEWIESENGPASIPGIRCCTSATPQFIDWNQDGNLDILSGSYATGQTRYGHLYLLNGLPNGKFQPAQFVVDKDGRALQMEALGADQVQSTMDTLCTHPHAVDFDVDGDLDLFAGTNGGRVFYLENQGNSRNPQFAQSPEPLPFKVNGYRSAPHAFDWDEDGDFDLLVGTHDGAVCLFRNTGKRGQPGWEFAQILIAPTSLKNRLDNSGSRGDSARVWVADWNKDGVKDILVGDRSLAYEPLPNVSADQFRANESVFFGAFESILKIESGTLDSTAAKNRRLETDRKQMELLNQRKLWARETGQGAVWLYLGKNSLSTKSGAENSTPSNK